MGSHLHKPSLFSVCWEPLHEDTPELVSVQPGREAGLKNSKRLKLMFRQEHRQNHGGALNIMRG